MEKRWGIPYGIVGDSPKDPIDKCLVFVWPAGLVAILLKVIIKIVLFFFNGFRWPGDTK